MSHADSQKYRIEAEGDKGVIQQVSYLLISYFFARFLVGLATPLTWTMRPSQLLLGSSETKRSGRSRTRMISIAGTPNPLTKTTKWSLICSIMKKSKKDSFLESRNTLIQYTEEN